MIHTVINPEPVKMWVFTYDCQDYYCDGEHLVGVFTDKAIGEAVVAAIMERNHYARRYEFDATEIEIDTDVSIIEGTHEEKRETPKVSGGYAVYLASKYAPREYDINSPYPKGTK